MIAIRVVSRAGVAPGEPVVARFGEAGGDIGRGAECTLVLADPDRRVSRRQALVECRGGRFFIRQIGASLVVELDGTPIAPDAECPLRSGAEVRIGAYLLRVEEVHAAPTARPPAAPPTPPRAAEVHGTDPLALLNARPARPSAFADLLEPAAARRAPAPAPPPDPPREIDLVVGDPTGSTPRLPPAPAEGDAIDALFAGLGLANPSPAARSPQQMRVVGELLRELIGGTLGLLAARTAAKRELGAGATMLQTRANNPLKFSPDADAALALLLGPPQRGFVAAPQAAREAFDDLRAHQVAVLAGMRAALDAVLARFDPQALEQRLAPAGLWDQLLPAGRRAKLWEQYGAQYGAILREVEGDFDTLFGRAFLQAYDAQLDALSRPPPTGADAG